MHLVHIPQADGAADRQWQPVHTDPALCLPDGSTRGPWLQSESRQGDPVRDSAAAEPSGL